MRSTSPPGPHWPATRCRPTTPPAPAARWFSPVGRAGRKLNRCRWRRPAAAVKDGGWLAYNAGRRAASTRPRATRPATSTATTRAVDSWLELPLVPEGIEGKVPGKGAVGVSPTASATSTHQGQQHAVGFWRYDIDSRPGPRWRTCRSG